MRAIALDQRSAARPEGRVPSAFQEECGHEFLYTLDDMWRAIKYVRDNPLKEKKPVQHWSFVTPYDGT